eukprot:TRINITY_DN97320_c0_g1_i1.p2 TRINITY_DN97320_c0_g1~~TRINITY_DN97320_c0_g1_i1.p2  ORF type:complete len:185 (-),score=9.90 TRINITY_DN97320_c0_g1_i1:35-535(-)
MSGILARSEKRNICRSGERNRSCRRRCENNYNGSFNACTNECSYTLVLVGFCKKVDESQQGSRGWKENSNLPGPGSGCYWDRKQNHFFDKEYEYGSNIQAKKLTIYVRSARDPYLNFQYATDGSKSFGLTWSRKKSHRYFPYGYGYSAALPLGHHHLLHLLIFLLR